MRLARWRDRSGTEWAGPLADGLVTPVKKIGRGRIGDSALIAMAMAGTAPPALDDPVAVQDVMLLAPVRRPGAFRDFMAFEQHVATARARRGLPMDPDWYQLPVFYFTNPHVILGPDEELTEPATEQLDFELEVAAVIGRDCADVTPEQAVQAIAGYTIFNDFSARDLQAREMRLGLGPAKGKDSRNSLGPAFVTADEFAPYASGNAFAVQMSAHVNDEYVGGGSMDQMDWSWGEIASYASRGTTLRPGDVLGSGTVPTGCLLEHLGLHGQEKFRGWLQPGDRVRLEIDHIGALEHEIVAGPPVHRLRTGF